MEALLERVDSGKPPVQDVVDALEALGYSWAQRLVASASECLFWREGGLLRAVVTDAVRPDALSLTGMHVCRYQGLQCT